METRAGDAKKMKSVDRSLVIVLLAALPGCRPHVGVAPLRMDVIIQTQADAERKSVGCVSCHGQTDQPTMHSEKTVHLGCVDCHGGSPEVLLPQGAQQGTRAYQEAERKAHVEPRYPDAWAGPDGKYSSANPKQSYTILNVEDPRFIRFMNPGDLRVARQVCGLCHPNEVAEVERSTMTTTSVFWSAAAYNNGIVVPAIGAQKTPFLGESYGIDGVTRGISAEKPPTPDEIAKHGVLPLILPLPRWEVVPPGDIFRVFERGGRTIGSSFPDIGSAPSIALEEPGGEESGKPELRQSNRGPGTGLRIAVPLLNVHKTRLNDPHLSFLGTNDNPGDYRSSGCTACHVIYANDRDPVDAGPYAQFGNRGQTQTKDPTISRQETGHPLRHEFTTAIPSSQCMVCHMHQPNVFVNSYLGYTMWDYETGGESMWPKQQKYPSDSEIWEVQTRNPEGAAPRGNWSDPEFLARVSELNPQLKNTQFADYHGHGWNFRAVFKRDRSGNLLDDRGAVVANPTPELLQRAMKPHTDEEWKNGRPGIPVHLKDIHLEKGMHCVDCHFQRDAHGTGNLYGQYADAIEISCVDCHGTIDHKPTLVSSGNAAPVGGTKLQNGMTPWKQPRFEWRGEKLIQHSMVEKDKEWDVVQVADTVNPESAWSKEHPEAAAKSRRAKTLQKDGQTWGSVAGADKLAHSNDRMACFTCHLSWTPSCAGCHMPIQANWSKTVNHFEGEETRNWATYNPQVARDDQFILGIHGTVRRGGKDATFIAPVRSSSAVVLSSENTNREHIYIQQPPISAAGYSSQAFNPHFPHTVRAAETKQCSDCHLSEKNDNNAWMAQLLGHGTNFPNFLGRYIYVGEGTDGFEAVPVTEWDEPQAVIGSYLHKIAYPDNYAAHKKRNDRLDGPSRAHGANNIRSLQMRGEYLYTADGSDGLRVFDIASVDNKGFSQKVITSPVSPLGQRTYVKTRDATAVALGTTMPVSPSRQERPGFVKHKDGNQEQPMHPIYRYAFVTDRYEGLVAVDIETLADGDPDNNFLKRAVTFNPNHELDGARNITIAGIYAYISCNRGLALVSLDDPLHPRLLGTIGAPNLVDPTVVAVQFRYAFVLDRQGLKVIDITNPQKPTAAAALPIADAHDLYVARGYAYVAGGKQGLVIVDVEHPEKPRIDQVFDAGGKLNDARAVRVGSTNASLFAYVADGKNGLRVVQLTSPPSQPNYYGFNPRPVPELIATFPTSGPAIALSKGLDRDRAVDESGNQVSIFGRLGSRPFNLEEQQRLYMKNGSVYRVSDSPTPAAPGN
jgi:hypothetical protein